MNNQACFALTICAAALFAGCGGSAAPPARAPNAIAQNSTSPYEVLYRFSRTHDGGRPDGSLLAVNGMLYGTTHFGGGGTCSLTWLGGTGCGTVFQLDPKSGKKKQLHSFSGGTTDGAYPNGSLIDVNGTLYGTTAYGGGGCSYNDGCGSVFSITTNGTETMLHSFDNKSDGKYPYGGLLDVKGTLYGTTAGGGDCCGTVFSISTSGSEKIVYNFAGHSDGANPHGALIDVKGTLYGTTSAGGSSSDGTVYSVTPTGTEKVLHSFAGSPDGAMPSSGLVDVSGALYGTTPSGGDDLCYEVSSTCGIVYSITTAGKEKVVYTFLPTNDYEGGAAPSAGLINVNGVLYGTAPVGGNGYGCYNVGCGVVYSLTTNGYEAVLHVFNGGSDGAGPDSALVDLNGTLYGTTPYGGAANCPKSKTRHSGCGIVFAVTP